MLIVEPSVVEHVSEIQSLMKVSSLMELPQSAIYRSIGNRIGQLKVIDIMPVKCYSATIICSCTNSHTPSPTLKPIIFIKPYVWGGFIVSWNNITYYSGNYALLDIQTPVGGSYDNNHYNFI